MVPNEDVAGLLNDIAEMLRLHPHAMVYPDHAPQFRDQITATMCDRGFHDYEFIHALEDGNGLLRCFHCMHEKVSKTTEEPDGDSVTEVSEFDGLKELTSGEQQLAGDLQSAMSRVCALESLLVKVWSMLNGIPHPHGVELSKGLPVDEEKLVRSLYEAELAYARIEDQISGRGDNNDAATDPSSGG